MIGNIDLPRLARVADRGKETDSEIIYPPIDPICTHVNIFQFVIKMYMFTADLYKTHEKVVMTLFSKLLQACCRQFDYPCRPYQDNLVTRLRFQN